MNFQSNKVILTFDDGLIDHYTYVFPELKKRNIPGIFFINTISLELNHVLPVHQIHYLLAKYDNKLLLDLLNGILKKEDLYTDQKKSFQTVYDHQQNSQMMQTFKQTLNYFIDKKTQEDILKKIMKELNEDLSSKTFYINKDQILEMHQANMIIGAHTHTHSLLSTLTKEEQKEEIHKSISILDSIIGAKQCRFFSYPFGSPNTYNHITTDILKNSQIDYSFIVQSKDITKKNIEDKHFIPRYNCNEFLYGQVRKQ